MARTIMVTRTVAITRATAMCVDTVNAEIENRTFDLSGAFKNEAEMLQAVQALLPMDLRAVSIVDVTTDEVRYGMPLDKFMQYGNIITKPDTDNTNMTEEE